MSVNRGTQIIFWYNNPETGSKGWKRGRVDANQNEYLVVSDTSQRGLPRQTRKYIKSNIRNLSVL